MSQPHVPRAFIDVKEVMIAHGPEQTIKGVAAYLGGLGPEYEDVVEALEKIARTRPIGWIRAD